MFIGSEFATKAFTIDSTGTLITSTFTVKSFLVKAVGAGIRMRWRSTDSAADAYLMDDGESLNFDVRPRFPIGDNFSTIGFFDTASGSATLLMIVAH